MGIGTKIRVRTIDSEIDGLLKYDINLDNSGILFKELRGVAEKYPKEDCVHMVPPEDEKLSNILKLNFKGNQYIEFFSFNYYPHLADKSEFGTLRFKPTNPIIYSAASRYTRAIQELLDLEEPSSTSKFSMTYLIREKNQIHCLETGLAPGSFVKSKSRLGKRLFGK